MKVALITVLALCAAAVDAARYFPEVDKLDILRSSAAVRAREHLLGNVDHAAVAAATKKGIEAAAVIFAAKKVRQMQRMEQRRALMEQRQLDPATREATVQDPRTGKKLTYTNYDETMQRIADWEGGYHAARQGVLHRAAARCGRMCMRLLASHYNTPERVQRAFALSLLKKTPLLSGQAGRCFEPLEENGEDATCWAPYRAPVPGLAALVDTRSPVASLTAAQILKLFGYALTDLPPMGGDDSRNAVLARRVFTHRMAQLRRLWESGYVASEAAGKASAASHATGRLLWSRLFELLQASPNISPELERAVPLSPRQLLITDAPMEVDDESLASRFSDVDSDDEAAAHMEVDSEAPVTVARDASPVPPRSSIGRQVALGARTRALFLPNYASSSEATSETSSDSESDGDVNASTDGDEEEKEEDEKEEEMEGYARLFYNSPQPRPRMSEEEASVPRTPPTESNNLDDENEDIEMTHDNNDNDKEEEDNTVHSSSDSENDSIFGDREEAYNEIEEIFKSAAGKGALPRKTDERTQQQQLEQSAASIAEAATASPFDSEPERRGRSPQLQPVVHYLPGPGSRSPQRASPTRFSTALGSPTRQTSTGRTTSRSSSSSSSESDSSSSSNSSSSESESSESESESESESGSSTSSDSE